MAAIGPHWRPWGPFVVLWDPTGGRGAVSGCVWGPIWGAVVTALRRQGLDLAQCSMYEDISQRPQPTYEDVGTRGATAAGLEKP